MSFLSCTFDDGVFALKLDFSFGRRKAARPKPSAPRVSAPRPSPSGKKKGAKPLPPPFALPPVRRSSTPVPDLLAALPPPPVPDFHLNEPPLVPGGPNDPTYPSVIVDNSFARGPGATMLMDEDDSPLEGDKTDVMQQRRDVRKALRSSGR